MPLVKYQNTADIYEKIVEVTDEELERLRVDKQGRIQTDCNEVCQLKEEEFGWEVVQRKDQTPEVAFTLFHA